jgi:hypothetical protein
MLPAGRPAALLLLIAALTGCASAVHPMCRSDERAWIEDRLYFGTTTPTGVVSDDERAAFLREIVTPRFPDGFTTWRADGQWRDGQGRILREASFVFDVVHPEDDASGAKIAAIVAEYRARHHQESVLRVRTPACVTF